MHASTYADAFFPDAGGSSGEATDPPATAAAGGYVDAVGSPSPVAYGMPEPVSAYDGVGDDDQFGGGDQFSGGGGGGDPFLGGGEQFGGSGGEVDQFSGMPLQVGVVQDRRPRYFFCLLDDYTHNNSFFCVKIFCSLQHTACQTNYTV